MSVIKQALLDIKTAAATAAGTVLTSAGLVVDLIPDDIGKVGSLVGIILSSVLIYTHFRNGREENRKLRAETALREMEVEQLRRQLNDES